MSFSLVSLIVFLFPLAYSAGPGNMFFAANGARFGFRATIPANLGYHAATFVVTLATGLGLKSGLDSHPTLFTLLKISGGLYVLWLAWKLFRSGALDLEADVSNTPSARDGVLLMLLNPKAYVIIAVMYTQFLSAEPDRRPVEVLLIASIFTVNNLVAFSLWASLGDGLTAAFRSQRSAQVLNSFLSLTLGAVAIWILLA